MFWKQQPANRAAVTDIHADGSECLPYFQQCRQLQLTDDALMGQSTVRRGGSQMFSCIRRRQQRQDTLCVGTVHPGGFIILPMKYVFSRLLRKIYCALSIILELQIWK